MQINEITQSLNAANIPVTESDVASFLKSTGVKPSEINAGNITALIEHFEELSGSIAVSAAPIAVSTESAVSPKSRSKKGGNLSKVNAQPPVPIAPQHRQEERQEIQSGIQRGLQFQAREADQLATMIETGAAQLTEAAAQRIHHALANITPNAATLALQAIEEGQVDAGFFCDGLSQHIENALAVISAGAQS